MKLEKHTQDMTTKEELRAEILKELASSTMTD